MTLREAAQQALDFIVALNKSSQFWLVPASNLNKTVTALRAALVEDAMRRLTDVQQEIEPTSQESRQVEPVAYVTGYSKGYATVQPIDPCLLMPVGMALYRSPPKREPMTEQQLDEMFDQAEIAIYIADRQQKEHLEVYSFGVRDAEKWHDIGGEK